MEICRNTFCYLIIVLLIAHFVFFSSCRKEEYLRIHGCQDTVQLYSILASVKIDENRWLAIKMNPVLRDQRDEFLHDSRILLVEVNQQGRIEVTEIPVENRDEYPFKPVSIAYDKRGNLVYILNIAFFGQRSIEIYEWKNRKLYYKLRHRSRIFRHLVAITFYNSRIVGLLENKNFLFSIGIRKNQFLVKDEERFRFYPGDYSGARSIKAIENSLFLLQPEPKKITILDESFSKKSELHFDRKPVDVEMLDDKLVVLLSDEYYSVFESNRRSVTYFSGIDVFLYEIPGKELRHGMVNLKNVNHLRKIRIPEFYANSLNVFFLSRRPYVLLNHWDRASMLCNIERAF